MKVEQAKEQIRATVSSALALCKENGLIATGKVYYSDKALSECAEFNENAILLFGAIRIGVSGMDEEDFCTLSLCSEIKVGLVNDEELTHEIEEFNKNLANMLEEIGSGEKKEEKILEINARQEKEAEKSMQEFNAEMRKMKIKLYSALGILGAIVAAIIIGSIFI